MREDAILETKYWEVILSTDQTYLGRSLIILLRPCGDLAEITQEELLEFHGLVRKLQDAARQAWGATMFNWSCLMNHAYQEETPKPQVHWHFRPRYQKPVTLAGETFNDPNFGRHYLADSLTGKPRALNQELRDSIIAEYKKVLN